MIRALIIAFWLSVAPALADGVSAPIAVPAIGQSTAAVKFPPNGGGGGGGGATVTALFGTNNGAGFTAPYNAGSFSFSNGEAVVGIITSIGGGFPDITGVTIKGVAATKIGTGVSNAGNAAVSLWHATVTAGSGSVIIANGQGTISQTCVNGWMITGIVSGTPTASVTTDNFAGSHADPQSLGSNLVVSSGGVGVVIIAASFRTAAETIPPSWTNATRDSTAESNNTNGNGYTIAGAHESSAGSYAVSVSGASGSGWEFNGMIGAAWQ